MKLEEWCGRGIPARDRRDRRLVAGLRDLLDDLGCVVLSQSVRVREMPNGKAEIPLDFLLASLNLVLQLLGANAGEHRMGPSVRSHIEAFRGESSKLRPSH